jgi:type VI protein secretion system component Hcp
VALLAVGAVGGGAALAVASVPDSSGQIHACVNVTTQGGVLEPNPSGGTPNITVIDPSAGQHCIADDGTITNQTTLSWNAKGPQGPAGVPGTPGAPGKTGGAGATGKGITNAFTITPPALKSNAPAVGAMTLGSGRTALTFNVLTSNFAARGKGNIHDISLTKSLDNASPKLLQAAVKGTHIKSGILTLRKAGGEDKLLVIKLSNVLISSDQTEASPGKNSTPSETLSFNFTKIEFKYQPQDNKGTK